MVIKYIKLENSFNPTLLKRSLSSIINKIPYEQNQISLQHRSGVADLNDGIKRGETFWYNKEAGQTDMEFCNFYEKIQNEYIVECLKKLPFKVYRTRIMVLEPQTCYPLHYDKAIRLQIPIDTAENQGRFVFESGELLNLEEGSVYVLNTTERHSAINFNKYKKRTHLISCLEEKEKTNNEFVKNIYKQFNL